MRDRTARGPSWRGARRLGVLGFGLLFALMAGGLPSASADKHDVGGSGGSQADPSATQEGEWVLEQSFGPANGTAYEGDGVFFRGEQEAALEQDRIYQDRWIELEENQTLVVTVRSGQGMPDFLVLNEASEVVGGVVIRQPAEADGQANVAQLELLAPYSGRYRIRLTSVHRFQDLSRYEIEAAIYNWEEPEPPEEPEVEIDPDAPDFSDFNNPPQR